MLICKKSYNFVRNFGFMDSIASFPPHISKEEINNLPVVRFTGESIVVDSPAKVNEAVAYLSAHHLLGVDTESRPSFQRGVHYPTALVQIATDERCYLFRLSKIGMPPALAKLFADKSICKVGLAFRDDINGLRRLHDFRAENCIDLQSIIRRYGILDLGLQKIFAILFGQKISKSQQLTNWESDTLTHEQISYASTDAWATLRIYEHLQQDTPLPPKQVERMVRAEREAQIEHQHYLNQQNDIKHAVEVLKQGGIIIYPTDTVWGIGCDATNAEAVERLFAIKQRPQDKAMLVLVDSEETLRRFVPLIPDAAQQLLSVTHPEEAGDKIRPLTIIYPQASKALVRQLCAPDGSIGVRVTEEPFSKELCLQLQVPLVSTSANFAGSPTPKAFCEIHKDVLTSADYVCRSRRSERGNTQPSSLIKVDAHNHITILRH